MSSVMYVFFFFFKQKTAYEMRISDWSSDVCSSDLTWFPRIKAANQNERAGSERAAINAPIQGTSADLIKRAMARMPKALADAGLSDVRMLLQVHDELVFAAHKDKAAAAGEVIRAVLAGAADPAVKTSVTLAVAGGTRTNRGQQPCLSCA